MLPAHGKGSFDRENEHAPPANRGPTGNQAGGGRTGKLLHLTEVFLFSVSLWDRDQKRPVEIEAESMGKLKRTRRLLCLPVRGDRAKEARWEDKRRSLRRCDD